MRVWTNFALISALLTTDALAVGMAPNTRARPGSVSGAMITNAQQNQQPRANTTGNTTPATTNTTKPTTTTATPTTAATTECGEVLPLLGVDVCVARTACAGIKADGHPGVFDEKTTTCKIPVCAHNWSGVIQKSDEDVCTLVDMNTAVTCNADLFDQIDNMRRSSQWVIPLAVVGGAGIGAGIGALIDKKQEAKASEIASKSNANDKAFEDMKNAIPDQITFMGTSYNLKQPKDIEALKVAIKNSKDLPNKITEANDLIDSCAKEMFSELVSIEVKGSKKWGRIKISEETTSCSADDNKYIYCQFQNIHADGNKKGDCDKGNFVNVKNINSYLSDVGSTHPKKEDFYYGNNNKNNYPMKLPNGTCYFRDSQGSGETDVFATVQADLWRTEFLTNYRTNVKVDPASTNKFRADLKNSLMSYNFSKNQVSANGVNGQIMNYVLVMGPKFSTILDLKASKQCTPDAINAILPSENNIAGSSTNNILMESYGALLALQKYGNMDGNLDAFLAALNFIDVYASAVANYNAGLGLEIEENFGKKRGFFQKAIGRGLLIGGGVGAVAGLGYWFAEGSSTFCNVGGLEQVKLKKSYSIPSFRDYLFNKGLIQ